MLILVSDATEVSHAIRAGEREVWRWVDAHLAAADDGRHFRGDPTEPATYGWAVDATAVTAVIELRSSARAEAVSRALRSLRPDAAVLMLCDDCTVVRGDGTVARAGRLHSVLRIDLEDELQWLEAQRRVYCLRRFAADAAVVPILIHADPDPDALSSALATRVLLRGNTDSMPIVTLGAMHRPENRRMAELLRLRVTQVTAAELRGFGRLIVLDGQPPASLAGGPELAVVDHHPLDGGYDAAFLDVRPELGAAATMLTQYLRADGDDRFSDALATALLYGIKTDTDSLRRGVSTMDVEAYAFLQRRVDPALLLRFERPAFSLSTARALGSALATLRQREDVAVAFLGEIDADQSHSLADLADFCLAVEEVNWAVACAVEEDDLVLSIRQVGNRIGAGALAHALAQNGGSGGGHDTMARAVVPLAQLPGWAPATNDDAVSEAVLTWIEELLEGLRDRQSSSARPSSAGA
jgi:nanoRNase/pAp phosphatase (c-di-AMP/oligoRNAs hydrolase)